VIFANAAQRGRAGELVLKNLLKGRLVIDACSTTRWANGS